MARLGSVLGAILAELDRARVAADTLTRDLVNEYRADPILASMSVPRLQLDQAELTLRFSVNDLQETEPAMPAVNVAAEGLTRHARAKIMPGYLEHLGLHGSERDEILAITDDAMLVGTAAIKTALTGDVTTAARETAQSVGQVWDRIPRELRTRIGSKASFVRGLEARLNVEVPTYLGRLSEGALIKAALASTIDVGIRSADLAATPEHLHELKLTLRGEDVTVVLRSVEGSG